MNHTLPIERPFAAIEAFCCRQPIRKLSLFNSILRDDFKPESDVDMLVEFTPGAKIGYVELVRMEIDLTKIVGRKVDLRTPMELSQYFRQRVLDEAEPIYVLG